MKALNQYLITALWSSTDDNSEPLDSNYSIEDIDQDTINQAETDLSVFLKLSDKLTQGHKVSQVAHDFWLTRNGHGAGFWDGDYEHGEELTELCKKFKPVDLYIGDDGEIYSI